MSAINNLEPKLKKWLEIQYSTSNLSFVDNSFAEVGDFRLQADLIMLQSKSNVIHAFELKETKDNSSLKSAIWHTYCLYGNYKWLVITEFKKDTNNILISEIKDLGIGLISYESGAFKVIVKPEYVDGNFLKFWPTLKKAWENPAKIK